MARLLRVMLALVLALSMMLTCVMVQAEEEPIEVTIATYEWDVKGSANTDWIWQKYEEMTGVHVNWIEIPQASAEEKKMTMFASGDLPDAFFQFDFSVDELYEYGQAGTFINLADYEDCTPALNAFFESDKAAKAACVMPDGGIYGFPGVSYNTVGNSLRYYINGEWLDRLNLEVPETLEELTATFEACKTQDANGNGDPDDEWPIYIRYRSFGWAFERAFEGVFGLGDHGNNQCDTGFYLEDSTDTIEYIYTSDKCKAMWQQFAEWWAAGYFYPETFGNFDYASWVTAGKVDDVVGFFQWAHANFLYDGASKIYPAINQFRGGISEKMSYLNPSLSTVGAGIITNKCKYPERMAKWFDYFYSDAGRIFTYAGVEGETYFVDEDGVMRYTDAIMNYDGGWQLGSFQYGLFTYGGGVPSLELDTDALYALHYSSSEEEFGTSVEDCSQFCDDDIWPAFIAIGDEQAVIDTYATDLDNYVTESRVKFVTGEWNFDEDWDAYVAQLNSMGVAELQAVRQAQYDRYVAAQQ